jgi:hypothetical protein
MPRTSGGKRKAEASDEQTSNKSAKLAFDPVQAEKDRQKAVAWASAVLQSPAAKKTPAKKSKARVPTPELPKAGSPPKAKVTGGSVYERALAKEAAANAAAAAAAAAPTIVSKPPPPAPVNKPATAKGSSVYERALSKEKASPPGASLPKTSAKPVPSSPPAKVAAKNTKGSIGQTLLSAFILLSGLSLVLVLVGSKGQPMYISTGLALVSGLAYLFFRKK